MTPLRIQLRRSKGWRMPPNTISVARPGRWGNPFRMGGTTAMHWNPPFGGVEVVGASHAVALYRQLVDQSPRYTQEAREELRGRNLACWCHLCPAHAKGKPLGLDCPDCAPCHADPLGRVANS